MQVSTRLAAISLVLASAAFAQQSAPAYAILSREGRKTLPFRAQGGQDLVALPDVAAAFALTVREDVAAGGIVVTTPQNRTIVLTPGQPLASAAGRVVSLPSPPVRDGRVWLVPVEFISRALGPALNTRLEVRKVSRLIVTGDMRVPEVAVSVEGDASRARVNLDITPPAPRAVTQDGQRLIVRLEADGVDLRASQPDSRDIVAAVRTGDTPQTIVIDLGPKAGAFQTSVQPREGSERLVIDIAAQGAPPLLPPGRPGLPPAAELPPLPDFNAGGGLRTIVIDPGHGGDERGARGRDGAEEKAIALRLAYRLKAALESALGVRVLLTRDADRAVRIDERTALANNNKADMFISLHANAAPSPGPAGAQVLTLAAEGYAPEAQASAAPPVSLPVFGGGARSIEIIAWDTAQIRWLGESDRLAGLVHAELATRVPMHPRALGTAPLRVLIGANMPAVLIEAGFLTNADQEKALAGESMHEQIVQALMAAIVRYRDGHSAAQGQEAPAQPAGVGR